MSGQRRAKLESKLAEELAAVEVRVTERIDGEDMSRRNEFVALRERLERAEFNLRLCGVGLVIMIVSAVIQAVSR
jgi:hypothetical protein